MSAFKKGDAVQLNERGRNVIGRDKRDGAHMIEWRGVVTTTPGVGDKYISVRRLGNKTVERWAREFWQRRVTRKRTADARKGQPGE